MAKADWKIGDTVKHDDMNTIGGEINQLREDVDNIEIPSASLTEAGIVQLSNKTDGTSETVAATEKAVNDAGVAAISAAKTNAEKYADDNFVKPSEMMWANLLENSSGALGMTGWTPYAGSGWTAVKDSGAVSNYFGNTTAVASGDYSILESDVFNSPTSGAGTYNLQAVFFTIGTTAGVVMVEVLNGSTSVVLGTVAANLNASWHRKTSTITVPAGTSTLKVRLVIAGPVAAGLNRAFSKIKLSYGSKDVFYTNEADISALFQYASDRRAELAAAITGKGVATAADATMATMVTNVGLIQQGNYQRIAIPSPSYAIPANTPAGTVLGTLVTLPAGTKVATIVNTSSTAAVLGIIKTTSSSGNSVTFALRDTAGLLWTITPGATGPSSSSTAAARFLYISIDIGAGIITLQAAQTTPSGDAGPQVTRVWSFATISMPSGFNTAGAISLVLVVNSTNINADSVRVETLGNPVITSM